MPHVVITIDGPAGAGKSTTARALAERLGFHFLDTGAMYRAVALAALRRGLDWNDPAALADLCDRISIEVRGDRILLDGDDVSDEIRTQAVTAAVGHAADNQHVRRRMIELQRREAEGQNIVTEGRDQGTLAFPDATCKVFLTASPQERAQRRLRQLRARGEHVSLEQVLDEQNERDRRDGQRPFGGLLAAPDAVDVPTDGLTQDEVVDRLAALVREKIKSQP
jgi:cytidylate kinase